MKGGERRGVVRAASEGPGFWGRLGRLGAPASVLLSLGCPQLLDDGFELGPPPDPSDTTPPTVVSITPGDGFAGVAPDVVIAVTFSEPMDRSSVEGAYASPDLPPGEVSFAWSEDDTVLHITPDEPLTVASGSDPDDVEPATYELELTSDARDVSGNALAAERVRFSVIREITQTLSSVRDRNLTGSWRSDGIYGVLDCTVAQNTVCVGDSLSDPQTTYKGFATFDSSELGDAGGVSAARLSLDVSNIFGNPFSDLGALAVEHVDFAEIGSEAFASEPLSVIGTMASSGQVGDTLGVDVAAAVNADLRARSRSQFRFAFSTATDDDGVADVIISSWTTLSLRLTYRTP